MAKYNTGDYFLDYAKNLCVIEYIAKVEKEGTYMRIKNIQNKQTYPYCMFNKINEEPLIFKWLGQIDNKTAQLLYIR